jgi:hypothetical protein
MRDVGTRAQGRSNRALNFDTDPSRSWSSYIPRDGTFRNVSQRINCPSFRFNNTPTVENQKQEEGKGLVKAPILG